MLPEGEVGGRGDDGVSSLADFDKVDGALVPIWGDEAERSRIAGFVGQAHRSGEESTYKVQERGDLRDRVNEEEGRSEKRKSRLSRMFGHAGGDIQMGGGGVQRVRRGGVGTGQDAVGRSEAAGSWSRDSDIWG